jgi:hypothetical protein
MKMLTPEKTIQIRQTIIVLANMIDLDGVLGRRIHCDPGLKRSGE